MSLLTLAAFSLNSQKELEGSEKGEDQPDWSAAAHHRANEGRGERGHRPAEDPENAGMPPPQTFHLSWCSAPPFLASLFPGGHHPDNEDEEAHQQRPAADGAGGDPEEHVFTAEEDDQRADRVADRSQVHQAGRDGPKHLHLHGVARRWRWWRPRAFSLTDTRTLPGSRPLREKLTSRESQTVTQPGGTPANTCTEMNEALQGGGCAKWLFLALLIAQVQKKQNQRSSNDPQLYLKKLLPSALEGGASTSCSCLMKSGKLLQVHEAEPETQQGSHTKWNSSNENAPWDRGGCGLSPVGGD